jgi:hypothetical protein
VLRDAQQLDNEHNHPDTAAALYVAALRILLRAGALAGKHAAPANAGDDRLSSLVESIEATRATFTPQLAALVAETCGEAGLAAVHGRDRQALQQELRRSAERIGAVVHAQQRPFLRVLRARRRRRIAAVILALTALAWTAQAALNPRNLALHRPVQVSSRDASYGVDPSGVVDGDELIWVFTAHMALAPL